MAITAVKIHPALGIARLGNSPEEFYIGPETADLPEIPPGGYKDAACRIKREGARFRLFAYHDDGTPPQEITVDEADIAWRVRLANKKAAQPERNPDVRSSNREGLVIAPSEKSVSGANARAVFDDGQILFPSVPAAPVALGEIRTDAQGQLVVLGGFGKSASPTGKALNGGLYKDGWYDDVSDGYVRASVVIDGGRFEAVGAWVIVAPPHFAPTVRPPITLYDRLYDYYASNALFGLGVPNPVSFRRHIYPIFQAARAHRGVHQQAGMAHNSFDESLYPLNLVQRALVVARLKQELGGDMPRWNSAQLTNTQYQMMLRWRGPDPSFVDDWGTPAQPLPLTPEELDRGPLSHSIGAAFYPGIEAGDYLVGGTNRWAEPFRFDQAVVEPGDATSTMSLPWQADFKACGHEWWPSHRPNETIRQGTSAYQDWDTAVPDAQAMVDHWHTLGFVVPQGADLVEVERCDVPYIVLLTPALHFADVPQGPGGVATSRAMAIQLEVTATSAPADFAIVAGADAGAFSRLTTGTVSVGPTGATPQIARLWVRYTTQTLGSFSTGTATVRHLQSGREWVVDLSGNTVGRQTTAVALVLDRSGSMNEPRGDAATKLDALKEAASLFVDVALAGDGIACIEYNQDVQGELAVTALGPSTDPSDAGRASVKQFIAGLSAGGSTSIGDGIHRGRQLLDAAAGYGRKAMVVLTDGKENQPRWIAEVASEVDATTYAVGIGRADNVNVTTLQGLTGNHGGYLLVTGPIASDNQFILIKYFLQILAGISNADVVLDPDGVLVMGQTHRIPFRISDADQMFDAILVSPGHRLVDFRLESPLGHQVTPEVADSIAELDHLAGDQARLYRVRLPVVLERQRESHPGLWHAVLTTERRPSDAYRYEARVLAGVGMAGPVTGQPALPYTFLVHSYSDVSLQARLVQAGVEPGSAMSVEASLSYFGAPYQGEAGCWAEVALPDGAVERVDLATVGEGRFGASFTASQPGVYRVRVRARGQTTRGWSFEREQTLTAGTAIGGGPPTPGIPAGAGGAGDRRQAERDRALCELLECLIRRGGTKKARKRLVEAGGDFDNLLECLVRYCRRLGVRGADADEDTSANQRGTHE